MHALLPFSRPVPLHDVAGTRRHEHRLAHDLPPGALMRRAGAATARLALAIAPHAADVLVVAGPGNNGGDGIEAACCLHALGRRVHLCWLGDPDDLSPGLIPAWNQAKALGLRLHRIDEAWPELDRQDLAIDALLGIGANRPPTGETRAAIERLNALPCPLLAVDVPTGLDADTGNRWGDVAIRASHTLTFLTAKTGLFTAEGREHAGRVWLDDLGEAEDSEPPIAMLGAVDVATGWPMRTHSQHKGSFGDVVVIGGVQGMAGAGLLAARAAHSAGAGRVYLSPPDGSPGVSDTLRPELMHRSRWWDEATDEALRRATVVVGCGGGDPVSSTLPRLLRGSPRLVLDADALNAIALDRSLQQLLSERSKRDLSTVLTPHPLEAGRMLSKSAQDVQADRLSCARELVDRFECIVVLKGSGTIVAAPSKLPVVNGTGNATLASAGTGDVLAGWLAGRWSAHPSFDPFDVAARSVMEHGLVADRSERSPTRAADLVDALYALDTGR